jgi:DNA-directed RNA polymerase specialized sigma24 family protein
VSVEQSLEVEAVEAARAHLDEVEQKYARECDTEEGVSEETALARAAAFEACTQAIDRLSEDEREFFVPF